MKTYRHVLLASGLTSVINGMLYPIMALYVYGISQDFFLVGVIIALPFLAAVPMSIVWGIVSDWIGSRRIVMVLAGTVGGILFFGMPFVGSTGLIALRLVQVSFVTSFVLLNAVATECFPKRKGMSVGNLALMGAIGQAVGALASGFLLKSSQMFVGSGAVTLVFWLAGIITVLGALSLLPMKERHKSRPAISKNGILTFGDKRGVIAVSSVALLLPLAGYIVFSVFPIYLKGLDIPWDVTMVAGMFTALSAVTGIFASGLAGHACDRHGRRKVLIGAGAAYVLVWWGMGMTVDPIPTAILWAIPVWSFFSVGAFTMVSDLTKPKERGRGIGLVNSAINMGAAIGSMLAGYLLAREMLDNIFFLAAAVAAIGLIATLFTRETLVKRAVIRRPGIRLQTP